MFLAHYESMYKIRDKVGLFDSLEEAMKALFEHCLSNHLVHTYTPKSIEAYNEHMKYDRISVKKVQSNQLLYTLEFGLS